ncbi:Voltage-dependent L-type calcium channel subunit alpha [Fasciolopsis buskii]|uniref:Voltage-dependent L-type calcium channel subunit alpha n=1 Tax=Fasciolopsis buskii TaxID=27845 RepID=A0A8E0RZL7_9TREM|nr:Voltage-dependent L-type calcium channel subunit alpha [Fasciolopsis buski]
MLLPPGSQNPWGSAPGGGGVGSGVGSAFLSTNRPVIADLALAALKERGEVQKKRICPQFRTDRSLCLMTKKNPIRKFCICIVDAKPFDYFILATILCNCLALAFNHPYPGEDSNTVNMVLEKVELAFVIIFTTESALKIIAYGFVLHPGAYLRTFWNVLDFSIVLIGLSSKALENMNVDVKALRAFRVLRPLRLLSGLPSLQIVLNSIITAMVPLLHIALLVIFVIIVYAIVGLELFQSKLHFTCYRNTSLAPEMMPNPRPCTKNTSAMGFKCSELGPEYYCEDMWGKDGERYTGPEGGIISFDNFLYSMLTVFVCITMEGWTSTGYRISDAIGSWWPWIYFVTLILLGSFFVMNLVLGVLSGEFSKEKEKIDRTLLFRKERQEKREQQDYLGYKEWIELAEELSDSEGEDKTSEDVESGAGGEMVEAAPEMHVDEVVKTHCHSTLRRLRKFRKRTRRAVIAFINSRQCFALIIILVFLNTVVLTTEHHNQPKWLDEFQDFANDVFVTLFTLEMLIKIAASGLADYFSKLFNRFDFFIVIFSILELLLVKFGVLNPMGVSVLRCARLLRIFKLTQYWESLRNLVGKLLKSVRSVASLLLLLSIFILICSLLGMQLFGGRFNFITQEKPRANFDGILQAMLTVFQILTGEDWNEVMYNGMRAYENSHWYAVVVVYFIFLFIVGNCILSTNILLNVFLAIAVDNLNDEDDDEEEGNGPENDKEQTDQTAIENGKEDEGKTNENETTKDEKWLLEREEKTVNSLRCNKLSSLGVVFSHRPLEAYGLFTNTGEVIINLSRYFPDAYSSADEGQTYEEMFPETDIYGDEGEGENEANQDDQKEFSPQDSRTMPPYSAFFIFSDTNKFRIFCHNVVCLSHFGNIVLVCILVSSILLAAEDPLNAGSQRNKILNMFDYFFTSVFTVEITLKMISYGFVLHEGSFCRSAFNLLDLIVVCVALISFVLQNQTISAVKILRVLRVLRPLRAINRAKGLKHVVQCMVIAIKSIGNIVLVTFLLQFMFGVIGVQLFKGKFYKCTDVSKHTEAECKGQYIEYEDMSLDKPSLRERRWVNNDFNFDDVPHALLTLFTVSTFEGWPDLLYTSIDSNAEDRGPITNYRPVVALFYISFIILIPFFMINIFVGFVIVTFQREGESEYKNCELNKNQRKCIEYALKARPRRRYIPKGHLQYKIWSVVVSKKFEIFIFICIFINTVALMLKYDRQDENEAKILDSFNYFFTAIFTVEFVLRLSAFSFRHYFGDIWNVIDFVLVLGSYIDIIVTQALPYVALLIAMIFFIYAVIGMQLFGQISIEENVMDGDEPIINRNNNFQNFFYALLVLFRCATGEAWQEIMLKCTAGQKCSKDSDDRETNECGSKLAYPYFISFHAISAFLVINLFVAVIMDNFDYLTRDWSILGPHHLDEFVTKWADYDPEAKGRVRHLDVVTMLGKISPPLGFGSMCPHTRACHKLVRMNMPLNSDGTVFFNATLFALVRRNLKIKIPGEDKDKDKSLDQLNEELRIVIKRIWKRTSPRLLDQIIPPKGSDVVTVGKFYATFLIQNWFREWQKRKMIQKDTRYIPQILRETSGGIFGRTLTEWTRRRSSKREPDRRGLIGGGIRGPIMDEHGITIDYANGGGGLMNNFGMNAQAGQTAHPAVMALLEKEKKEAEAAR